MRGSDSVCYLCGKAILERQIAGDQDIPQLTIALMGEPSRGHSPAVFDYKMRLRDQPQVPHVILMRFWERLIWQVAFHDPEDPPLEKVRPGPVD